MQVLPCEHHKAFHSNFSRECSVETTGGNLESSLSKQLKELKMKPRFCLAFASRSVVDDFEQLFPSFHHYTSSSQAKRLKQEDLVRKRAYIKAGNYLFLIYICYPPPFLFFGTNVFLVCIMNLAIFTQNVIFEKVCPSETLR